MRSEKYIAAGRKKIHENPAYSLSMGEMEYLANLGHVLNVMGDAFYMGVEAGYRIANKYPQRKSYEMGYKYGYKKGKAENGK